MQPLEHDREVDPRARCWLHALVSEPDRLQRESPELAALIEGLPDNERGRVVRRVVEQVAETTGIATDCRASSDLNDLVARLDEQAWDIQESGASAEYERAFARARAANAWLFASSGDSLAACHDAIYESLHAGTGDSTDIAALFDS
jgi:hypothetical protein